MKVIDLLNKIAKGEKFDNCKMKFKGIEPELISEYFIYDRLYEEDLELNDEVEIIEEVKDIEKIEFNQFSKQRFLDYGLYEEFDVITYKINELIDIVKELRSKQ